MNTDFVEDLRQRGLVHQTTSPELPDLLRRERVTAYIGFDPTAPSLHIGSLLPVTALMRLQRAGHRPIAVVGGGTGFIGDPGGKDSERALLSRETLAYNQAGLQKQLERFLDFGAGPGQAVLVNNADWLCELKVIDFLRDVGKHFSVNAMIQRDSVRDRLEKREQGISYTEFSYMLLQAYDYLALYDAYGCRLQVGGSDQWGNILSGCDLIRRVRGGAEVHGLTMPLVTRSDGKKFGKSESGNVWLDPGMTSPYAFYQFWLNVEDADVVRFLRYFTFLSAAEIDALEHEQQAAPEKRVAHRTLATEVTRMVHGPEGLARAERATAALFQGGNFEDLNPDELREALADSPSTRLDRAKLGTLEASAAALLAETGLSPSRGQARTAIKSGAVHVNNRPLTDENRIFGAEDLLGGAFLVLRRGKKAWHVVRVD